MTAYVFAGPTIARAEIEAAGPDMVCLPPVAQGDVYRVVRRRPRAIGIVDGYFEGVPAVLHKEILFAMAEGIHIFGSASMGALRAAELHAFGMRGVGRIFEAYRDERLEDDDEVAVVHGPAEAGYVALSESMVNIRATLERAVQEGVIGAPARQALERIGKELFYQARSWQALHGRAGAQGLPAEELHALRAWLPAGRIDQKREDALAMLAAMRELLAAEPEPMRVDYHFEWTHMWDEAVRLASAAGVHSADARDVVAHQRLLEELRLEPQAFEEARRQAFLRLLGLRECDRRRVGVTGHAKRKATNRFRAERGLFHRQEVERWLAENDLEASAFERLMAEESRLEGLKSMAAPMLDAHILDHLRLAGSYTRLAERARRKQKALAEAGVDDPQPGDAGLTPLRPRLWYFEHRLGQAMPEDIAAFARELGFSSVADFDRALLREYLYCAAEERSRGTGETSTAGD
ncbi:MAG: TfuA-like protein [Gammaproteobacteria bacterium]